MTSIRQAVPSDASALAVLAERTFRDTFEAMNSADDMARHCSLTYGEAQQLAEISYPAMHTLVCEENGHLIAFAQLRWDHAPACVVGKQPGEIQRLYVDRPWHGKGIAQQLMAACLRELEARACDVVWLGVWERNWRAQAFYRKFGFTEVGDHVFMLGSDAQRDLILVRPLHSAG
ncbi:MAG: GNAT family N-acetyltransferase [Ignavibacteriae bacterium]|nr:GNAT family N-acetyltransferase [Ignavibacteriota bacterium]